MDAPVVLHDPSTATSWRADPTTGAALPVVLRKDQPPANTCIDVEGSPHVLLVLPLPEADGALAMLFWHEQWHCVQAALGLPASEGSTAHLDSESGRTWLRLEMRALALALPAANDPQARQHAAAALAFRARRAALAAPGTNALAEEAKLERNEGLAEYTGRTVAAAGANGSAAAAVAAALVKADATDSFVRSMGYATGPAYGVLLDRWSPHWRSGLSADTDLPTLLARAILVDPAAATAEPLGLRYGGNEVVAEERSHARVREQRSAEHRRRFLGDDAVRLPLRRPSVSFDPRTLFPLDDAGTVYAPITVRDEWGELEAGSGALLSADWSLVSVTGGAVEGCLASWTGPDWTLELAEGWRLEQAPRGWRLVEGTPSPCPQ